MDLTVLYAFTPNAVAWTAYLGVLAQYTVYKTTRLEHGFEMDDIRKRAKGMDDF